MYIYIYIEGLYIYIYIHINSAHVALYYIQDGLDQVRGSFKNYVEASL